VNIHPKAQGQSAGNFILNRLMDQLGLLKNEENILMLNINRAIEFESLSKLLLLGRKI